MILYRKSPVTGEANVMNIPVTRQQLDAWESGERVKNVFPNLTSVQKEFIKFGIINEKERNIYLQQEKESE